MSELFPQIAPFDSFDLSVTEIHTIHVTRFGNPEGQPIIFLHGGPGGGVHPKNAQFFDPEKFHIILFDQRGCGNSKPFAEISENDTWSLVGDIEAIRNHLEIEKWGVFGGSWGSTLSLAYAITHPERVSWLILRGIFLGTDREINHLYVDGASRLFPDEFDKFLAPLNESEREDIIGSYYKKLQSEDSAVRSEAARAWSIWEGSIIKLIPDAQTIEEMGDDKFADAFARIECHYFTNSCFFESTDFILHNVHRIKDIPGVIIHGRYDVVCALESAWSLHKAWPKSELKIIPNAGHSASEPGICSELLSAVKKFS
jgi:proline iminopeptidase